jgi:uncharacterized membrane protein HdeD (DUF308 family)
MPLPAPASFKTALSKSDKDLLFKGVICTLIGLVVLLAPHVARAPSVREMFGGASLAGWFALVLGIAFIGRFVLVLRRKPASPRRAP